MEYPLRDAVTGAFSYTGKHIADRLLRGGRSVLTLTNHPAGTSGPVGFTRPDPFDGRVPSFPLAFDDMDALTRSLEGINTLYNTYWVRFPYRDVTYELAVRNTTTLIQAAARAGVRRIVHVSIANAAADSPYPYYRGKAEVEDAVSNSGLSWGIVRPTVLFGHGDVLINNMAWMLRRFPVFAVPGSGEYRIQPVFVENVAEIAVRLGLAEDRVGALDAAGKEVYSFNQLVMLLKKTVKSRARVVHVQPKMALSLARLVGFVKGDVVITKDEMAGLMDDLLVSKNPPLGYTRLSHWLSTHAGSVGTAYKSEIKRHYR